MSKIALGTAQFGMDYGINNSRGKVPSEEVYAILDLAALSGIDTLDTAAAYGDSEKVIGEYFRQKSASSFKIVSKILDLTSISASFSTLGVSSLYGLLMHDINIIKWDTNIWESIKKIRQEEKVGRIGVSIYYPEDVDFLLENGIDFDLLQLPYNLFDRRFEGRFEKLAEMGVEIHVRSALLQGLFFVSPEKFSGYFGKIKEKVGYLREISKGSGISILGLCLGFVLSSKFVSKVVLGVDNITQMKEIIAVDTVPSIGNELDVLKEDDLNILLPFNWQKVGVGQ